MAARPLSLLPIPEQLQAILRKSGYTTVGDLHGASVETLSAELKISNHEATKILQATGSRPTATNGGNGLFPASQSASSMLTSLRIHRTDVVALDQLVDGGLRRGQCLEIAGPPGSGKGCLALEFVRCAVKEKVEVLVVDCQSTMSPSRLRDAVGEGKEELIHHVPLNGFAELFAFLNQLSNYLHLNPSISLVVMASLSTPFQLCPNQATKTRLLALLKSTLVRIGSLHNVSYIVTMQLSTKLIKEDGSVGNFDTGAKAVMVPALGNDWFPSEKTYKLLLSRNPGGQRSLFIKAASTSRKNGSRGLVPFSISPIGRIVVS